MHSCLIFKATVEVSFDLAFLDFITVIGGYKIYLSTSTSGECESKDSVWETLQNEVITFTFVIF